MKKIMGLMLGLSLVLGTATVFAQDTNTASSDTATHKAKHSKKSKKSKKDTAGTMSGDTSTTK
jgi:hypothetical protein